MMNLTIGLVAIVVTVLSFACQNQSTEQVASVPAASPLMTISPKPDLTPTPATGSYTSVREIDFRNFTYPWTEQQMTGDSFSLRNGTLKMVGENSGATLHKIEYGDVTNDKKEEALISIFPETGGNCQCEMVYIYTLENGQLKLLWSFDTWDNAEGGLKRVYADKHDLVVETFGDNNFKNGKWDFSFGKKFAGYCCPTAFTKTRFTWNGKQFIEKGNREVFDYDWKQDHRYWKQDHR